MKLGNGANPSRLYFLNWKQGEIDDMISKVFDATGKLTEGKWKANEAPCYIRLDGMAREDLAKIMAATRDFSGQRVLE